MYSLAEWLLLSLGNKSACKKKTSCNGTIDLEKVEEINRQWPMSSNACKPYAKDYVLWCGWKERMPIILPLGWKHSKNYIMTSFKQFMIDQASSRSISTPCTTSRNMRNFTFSWIQMTPTVFYSLYPWSWIRLDSRNHWNNPVTTMG